MYIFEASCPILCVWQNVTAYECSWLTGCARVTSYLWSTRWQSNDNIRFDARILTNCGGSENRKHGAFWAFTSFGDLAQWNITVSISIANLYRQSSFTLSRIAISLLYSKPPRRPIMQLGSSKSPNLHRRHGFNNQQTEPKERKSLHERPLVA